MLNKLEKKTPESVARKNVNGKPFALLLYGTGSKKGEF